MAVLADLRDLARQHIKELARLAVEAKSEVVRVAAIREILDRGYGEAGPLFPGYDDMLDDLHPGHGGAITIEFVHPPERPEVIDGKPSPGGNGSRH